MKLQRFNIVAVFPDKGSGCGTFTNNLRVRVIIPFENARQGRYHQTGELAKIQADTPTRYELKPGAEGVGTPVKKEENLYVMDDWAPAHKDGMVEIPVPPKILKAIPLSELVKGPKPIGMVKICTPDLRQITCVPILHVPERYRNGGHRYVTFLPTNSKKNREAEINNPTLVTSGFAEVIAEPPVP